MSWSAGVVCESTPRKKEFLTSQTKKKSVWGGRWSSRWSDREAQWFTLVTVCLSNLVSFISLQMWHWLFEHLKK
jgi:hypothetical protein